jgi:hypothetical protein
MLHHMATILVYYGGHFESKMDTKIQKSSDLDEIDFFNLYIGGHFEMAAILKIPRLECPS